MGEPERELLVRLPELRGGRDVLERADGPVAEAVESLRALHGELERRGVADRVIFDLGLVRELGYYTGAVFEVYDPAVGFALGGGGRYDDLIGRFGRDLPACGVGLDVQRVHLAQAAEEALAMSPERLTIAVPRGALFDGTLDLLDRLGVDTAEVRSNDRKLLFEDAGIVTMRPSDVPDLRRARLRRHRHHRQGRPARAGPSARSTSCSTSASAAAAWSWPRARAATRSAMRCGGSGGSGSRPSTRAIAARHFADDRPPGRDRRGQGLGGAGAADRARRTGSSTSPPPARRSRENGLRGDGGDRRLHARG